MRFPDRSDLNMWPVSLFIIMASSATMPNYRKDEGPILDRRPVSIVRLRSRAAHHADTTATALRLWDAERRHGDMSWQKQHATKHTQEGEGAHAAHPELQSSQRTELPS